MTFAVKHSHGLTEIFETYASAQAAVRSVYADPTIGHSGDISEGGESTLVWASEQDAENDDGSRAIARITKRHKQ